MDRGPHPWRWQPVLAAAVGAATGLGIVVARIANAASYLSNAPETCLNCHVMTNAHATWMRGSHGRVAVCNDCHVPQGNLVARNAFKAMDGAKHSYVFTLRAEPQVLRLSNAATRVVQANCVRCHAGQLAMIRLAGVTERRCWDCHQNIHGDVRGLSASPYVRRPALPPAGMDFLNRQGGAAAPERRP